MNTDHSPGEITSCATNLATVNFKNEMISSIFPDHNVVRLDINYRKEKKKKKTTKNTNIWRLNNTLLNNRLITEEIKKEIKICTETNENENTQHHLWDSVKAVLKGKFTAIQAYLRKQEKHQISNLTSNVKQLEKEEKKNPKVNGKKS